MRKWVLGHHRPLVVVGVVAVLLVTVSALSAQPPIPHSVMDGDDCLSCHQSGVAGAPRVAWDHLGRSNDDCAYCHEVTGARAGEIPHPLVGRDDCKSCHVEGVGRTPRIGGNHVLYANEECQDCHTVSAAAAEPTPIPSPTPPPQSTHAMTGAETCRACHQLIFADEQHMLFTGQPLGDSQAGAALFAEACERCHGPDGITPVGTDQLVIGSEGYWAVHDDAAIIWGIGAGTHGQMTAFAEEYGGPLSWDQVLDLTALIRSWGPLTGPPQSEEGGSPTYTGNIGPMLAERCGGCHGGLAGLTMTDYDSLMAGSDSGPVILPSDPENSRLVQVQRGEHFAQLNPSELDLVIEWIAAGAPR